ncbi:hypothetical protein LY78DRAFT_122710 [Colletotrichum sublineola]|nr:hypothetical protein LY78DRAFT_122710 [Colletotrichum sublineola]
MRKVLAPSAIYLSLPSPVLSRSRGRNSKGRKTAGEGGGLRKENRRRLFRSLISRGRCSMLMATPRRRPVWNRPHGRRPTCLLPADCRNGLTDKVTAGLTWYRRLQSWPPDQVHVWLRFTGCLFVCLLACFHASANALVTPKRTMYTQVHRYVGS